VNGFRFAAPVNGTGFDGAPGGGAARLPHR
jgi:hypothetical protein